MVVAHSQDSEEAPLASVTEALVEGVDDVSLLGTYLRQAVRVPLLTAEQERELSKAREEGLLAKEQLADETRPEVRAALLEAVRRGEEAHQRLIEANLRLVVGVARQRQRRAPGLSLLDLVQEGNLGLMRAVEKYDYRLGFRFSTYAIWWIRRAIDRAIAEHGRPIRIPIHLQECVSKLAQAEAQFIERMGRQPTLNELAAATGIPEKKVEQLRRYLQPVLSLDHTTANDDGGLQIGDMLADGTATAEMEEVPQGTLSDELDRLLSMLSPREQRLIRLRFGLDDERERTLEEVGRALGVTRERARQIEVKALRKLRSCERTASLHDYFN